MPEIAPQPRSVVAWIQITATGEIVRRSAVRKLRLVGEMVEESTRTAPDAEAEWMPGRTWPRSELSKLVLI